MTEMPRFMSSGSAGQRDGKNYAVLDRKERDERGGMKRVSFHRTWKQARAAARKLNDKEGSAMKDWKGREVTNGARVRKLHVDSGAPAWADFGSVVGFGRTRVQVVWDGYHYGPLGDKPASKPHTVAPDNLEVV